jgi:hypothetical protein
MEILRVGHDAWGRLVPQGVSWDLLPIAAGIGVLVILGHAVYRLIRGKPERKE